MNQSPRSVLDTALACLERAFNQEEKDVVNRDLYSFSMSHLKDNNDLSIIDLLTNRTGRGTRSARNLSVDYLVPSNTEGQTRMMTNFADDCHSDDPDLSNTLTRSSNQTNASVQTHRTTLASRPSSIMISETQSHTIGSSLADLNSNDPFSSNGLTNLLIRPASSTGVVDSSTVTSSGFLNRSTVGYRTQGSYINRSFNRTHPINLIHQRRYTQPIGEQLTYQTGVSTLTNVDSALMSNVSVNANLMTRLISSYSNWSNTTIVASSTSGIRETATTSNSILYNSNNIISISNSSTTTATSSTSITTTTNRRFNNSTSLMSSTTQHSTGRSTISTSVSTSRNSPMSTHVSRLTLSRSIMSGNTNPSISTTNTSSINTTTLTNAPYAPNGSELAGFFHPILFIS